MMLIKECKRVRDNIISVPEINPARVFEVFIEGSETHAFDIYFLIFMNLHEELVGS